MCGFKRRKGVAELWDVAFIRSSENYTSVVVLLYFFDLAVVAHSVVDNWDVFAASCRANTWIVKWDGTWFGMKWGTIASEVISDLQVHSHHDQVRSWH